MPIYDLHCDACGHSFEKFVSRFITDEDKECPRCYSREVSQRFNGGSFSVGGRSSSSPASGGCTAPRGSSFG